MAFGLFEGSQLYLARISDDDDDRRKHGCEVIVSPVPFEFWPSACRLSVRLNDVHGALATATSFIRSKEINIMLSECCSTYQHRAHWDAICDLSRVSGFDHLRNIPRHAYDQAMRSFLAVLDDEFKAFAVSPINREAFQQGADLHLQFSPITGLNDVSFACGSAVPVEHRNGAVEIGERLTSEIIARCYTDGLPQHALITGNTEQRYMRVFFLKDYAQLFQLTVHDEIEGFAGGGVGILNQLLAALPKEINLMRASTYIVEKTERAERGRIEILGHWDLPEVADPEAKRSFMESEMRRIVSDLEVHDTEGVTHAGALTVGEFASPRGQQPRVFISYSTSHEMDKVLQLERALLAADFEPVRGTEFGKTTDETFLNAHSVGPDVMHSAFQAMRGCVAFVSLQVKRSDYEVQLRRGAQYVLPPWAIAEEVYAWSNGMLIIRLRDEAVEAPPYNRHAYSVDFREENDFLKAIHAVIEALMNFRASERFPEIKEMARRALFKPRPVPGA
jgi:hypothetical protein